MSKAAIFRKLHQGPPILVLPNAWDVASARIFEEAGFPAVGTTSAGVANMLGYADGEITPGDEMIAMVARIARALKVPVTGDVEGGYGNPLRTAQALADAGVAGMNLEDSAAHDLSLVDLRTQARAIEAIRAKTDLVINARCDVFLHSVGDPATRFEHTVERLNAYRQAGADCLFAPGVRDAAIIGRLAQAINGPLNVLAGPGMPATAELERLGVRRVSVGSGPMRAVMGLTQRIAKELREQGTYSSFLEGALPYADANRLFKKG